MSGDSDSEQVEERVRNQINDLRLELNDVDINHDNILSNVLIGWWFHPMRDFVLNPTIGVMEATIPTVVSTLQHTNPIVGYTLGGVSNVGHAVFTLGCNVGLLRGKQPGEQGIDDSSEPECTTTTRRATTNGTSRSRGFITDTVKSSYNIAKDFDEFFFDKDDDDDDGDDNDKDGDVSADDDSDNVNPIEFVIRFVVGITIGISWMFMGFTYHTINYLFPQSHVIQWIQTCHDFKVFIQKSGIADSDFLDTIADLLPNMMLLSRLQQHSSHGSDRIQSDKVASEQDIQNGYYYMKYASAAYAMTKIDHEDAKKRRKKLQSVASQIKENTTNKLLDKIKIDDHLSNMFISKEDKQKMYVVDEPYEYEARKSICQHCNLNTSDNDSSNNDLKEEDIVMFVKQSLLTRALRHFVAVNHVKKSVVLSIRGTFTFAELVVNASSKMKKYCGGYAHSGLADQTDKLWDVVADIIRDRLKANPGYELVVVGHSLGGAVACLLTIKIYVENLLGSSKESPRFGGSQWKMIIFDTLPTTNVKCYAYGSPAMFALGGTSSSLVSINQAVSNTICFIHDDDCVPTMSMSNLRNLKHNLEIVQSKKADLLSQISIIVGGGGSDDDDAGGDALLTKELVNTVAPMNGSTSNTMNGNGTNRDRKLFRRRDDDGDGNDNGESLGAVEKSYIPASRIIWMRGNTNRGYKAYQVDPLDLPQVYVDVDMFNDHKPPHYEDALEMLVQKQKTQ